MILQTDPALPQEINDFGCYFTSCLYHAERKTGTTFDVDRVLEIYQKAKAHGIVGDQCYVERPVSLMALAGAIFDSVDKAGVGVNPDAKGAELLHFHRDADTPKGMGNAMHDHFVAGDGQGNVAFDPLGDSNTVKYGFLQNKRIFSA